MSKKLLLGPVLILVIGLFFLNKYKSGGYPSSPSPSPSLSASPLPKENLVLVKVAHSPALGDYLTDDKGMTLYVSTKPCSDQCLVNWPPYVGDPDDFLVAANSTLPIQIWTAPESGGKVQYSYNDQLLYYYKGDAEPGDTKGNGVDSVWSVATVK